MRSLLFLAIASALINHSHAQTADSAAKTLDSIVVIGQKLPAAKPEGLVGSVDVIARDELANEHVDDTMEVLTKVPGVYISRYNQGLINTDIAIRGFAGDGETPHGALLIDGIPSNLHNGYSEMDQLFPMAMDSIAVFKGTSDPRVGLFNIAGNYRIETRKDVDTAEIEATIGSFAAREIQGYVGTEAGGITQNYFAGIRDTEGYRDRTDLRKYALSARWALDIGDQQSFALQVRKAAYDGDAPGYLSRTQSRLTPRASAPFADQDGGEKATEHASVHWDYQFSDATALNTKLYYNAFKRERWVRFSLAGALQNRFDDQEHMGLRSELNYRFADTWQLLVGLNIEQQDNIEQRFGTVGQARIRNAVNVLRNRVFEFDTDGAYLRLGQDFTLPSGGELGWNLGVRANRFDGDYVQFSASGVPSARTIYEFGTLVQPKLNSYWLINDAVSLFANYGEGFQHPLGADLYTAGDRSARDLSINRGYEVGASMNLGDQVQTRISYWRQDAKDEFVVVDGTGINVGETQRDGVDLSVQVELSEQLLLWANYTLVDSEIVRPASANRAFIGNELRSVPDSTGSLGLSYTINEQWSTRLHIDRQGDYYVNEANLGGQFGNYLLTHATIDYQMAPWKFSLQVNNLFDRFHEYVFDFSANGTDTIHSPGDGRAASFTVGYQF